MGGHIRSVHDRTVLIRGVHAKAELIRGVHDGAVLVRSVDVMRLHESTVQHSAMPGRRTPGRGGGEGRRLAGATLYLSFFFL